MTVGNIIGGIQGSIIAGRDVAVQAFTSDTSQQRAQRNPRAMLELAAWIKGVLEQSLHSVALIELGLEERAEVVEHPWDMLVQKPDQPNLALSPGTNT